MDDYTLKRYTNLSSLVSILKNKELTLLDPSKWEDHNDSYYLRQYAKRKRLQAIYALCFTRAAETAHHWRAFSNGSDGVCIKITPEPFKAYLDTLNGVVHRAVDYKLIDQVETEPLTVDQLPFLKRIVFRDELEYRVLYEKKTKNKLKTHAIPFNISLIQQITLSHSLPIDLKGPVVELLKSIEGCSNLKISRSTLNENSRWKRASNRVT